MLPWTPLTLGSLKICGKGSGAGVGATYWIRLTTSVPPPFIWSAGAARPTPLASSADPQSITKRSDRDMLSNKALAIIEFPPLAKFRPGRPFGFYRNTVNRCHFRVRAVVDKGLVISDPVRVRCICDSLAAVGTLTENSAS